MLLDWVSLRKLGARDLMLRRGAGSGNWLSISAALPILGQWLGRKTRKGNTSVSLRSFANGTCQTIVT